MQILKSRISQAEVARLVGVDQSTVSCALRGKGNIKEETRKKILDICRQYNYKPNYFAKNLRENNCRTIGVITPALRDPYFANIVNHIGAYLETNQYHCSLRFSQDNRGEQKNQILDLMDNSAAGVILLGTHPDLQKEINTILGRSVPSVTIGWTCPGTIGLATDQFNGAKSAYRHLISTGKKKIAILGDNRLPKNKKLKGYFAAAAELNMPEPLEIFSDSFAGNDHPYSVGYKYAMAVMERLDQIDAALCTSDVFALVLWAECKQRGIRVPEDLAIIGFDDIPFSQYIGLTTVRQPVQEMAKTAVQLLVEQINSYPKYIAENRIWDCPLIIRTSA